MSNISITQQCNRSCSYCFAAEVMKATPRAGAYMPLGEFQEALEFLRRSGVTHVSLLGGEPTIHPQFVEMIDLSLAQGFKVVVLSGGLMPGRAAERLERAAVHEVAIMMNVAPPGGEFSRREEERQQQVMQRFGAKVVLGLNIDTPAVDLNFLLEWIEQYGLCRSVRLGLAHPIAGGKNAFLHPNDYPTVGKRAAAFAKAAQEAGVSIGWDCGWVPCMFPEGSLEELGIDSSQVGLRCNPILDILPGKQVISCYPLASIARLDLPGVQDGKWLADRFNERLDLLRPMMLYKKCAACSFRLRGECTGGCLAGSMRRTAVPAAPAQEPVQ